MPPWGTFVAVLAITYTLKALSQDYSGVHEIMSGPEGSPVICLLLHGAKFTSATWSGTETYTMSTLADAGIRAVAIDIPPKGLSSSLPAGTDTAGLIPHFINKHRTTLDQQAAIVVAPSMSGSIANPYIASLTEETAQGLDAYVPVAPVAVSALSEATISPAVLQHLQVYAVYGGEDTARLGDLSVLESIFPKFGSTVVPGAPHPVYLYDPDLFNGLLIELARNITRSPLLPGDHVRDVGSEGAVTSENLGEDKESGRYSDVAIEPVTGSLPSASALAALVVGMTCVGLAVIFKLF